MYITQKVATETSEEYIVVVPVVVGRSINYLPVSSQTYTTEGRALAAIAGLNGKPPKYDYDD